jgi:hypothetical protein
LIELSIVGGIERSGRFFDGSELHECIVALHVDTKEFSIWLKQHLKVVPLGGFLVKVDHEECLRGLNVPTPIVFLALDTPISPSKFRPDS